MKLYQDTQTGERFIQLKPVGSWQRDGCRHYALWQPIKLLLWVFPVNTRESFWIEPWDTLREL